MKGFDYVDIFKKDLARYTFTEQCEEVEGLKLEDGTTKIFLNMTSKNGSKELISLLQYMKKTDINNPEVKVKDERLLELDKIVTEVRESEEWEAVKSTGDKYEIRCIYQLQACRFRSIYCKKTAQGTGNF